MAMETPQEKTISMGVTAARIVEITDEDETLVIAFIPLNAVRHHHHHDHHERNKQPDDRHGGQHHGDHQQQPARSTTMESKR